MDIEAKIHQLTQWYGTGHDGTCPTESQWRAVLGRAADQPVTLVNLFKLRADAAYDDGRTGVSGQEAFSSYGAVSMPLMDEIGGRFPYAGPCTGTFLGGGEDDWDLIALATYPDLDALLALFSNEAYRDAYHHRTAACERQKVFVCGA